jgi:hypothetical protein
MVAGFAFVPRAFDIPVAHWSEWVAALSGFAAGWLLATARRRFHHGAPVQPRS